MVFYMFRLPAIVSTAVAVPTGTSSPLPNRGWAGVAVGWLMCMCLRAYGGLHVFATACRRLPDHTGDLSRRGWVGSSSLSLLVQAVWGLDCLRAVMEFQVTHVDGKQDMPFAAIYGCLGVQILDISHTYIHVYMHIYIYA